MKFDTEICEGVSCPECPFNKGEDGCLLAKRLDEIEIIPEPCEDAVPRTSVEYICRKNTVSTNPYEHKYHDKFMQFMDDPEISDFGRWQHSNGFNTALVAVKCDLDKVPSAQPSSSCSHENEEFEWCHDCREYDKEAHCCHRWTKVIRKTVAELKAEQPEVIRCRDCKYNDMPPTAGNAGCTILYGMCYQDGFCSLAERRDDDDGKEG